MQREGDVATTMPSGTVTLLLADLEGSVGLWERHGEPMAVAMQHVDELVSRFCREHHGHRPIEQGEGDSFVAAFTRASDAVACALALQEAFAGADWPGGAELDFRMGIHTGEIIVRNGTHYEGPTINRCARIRALAGGRQVLLSRAAADLVADHLPDGASLARFGVHALRGMQRAEDVHQLVHETLRSAPARHATGVPRPPTSFVGRATELAEIRRLVDEHQVVTVTGAGGSGKTRLAAETAAAWCESGAGDAVWIDLAGLNRSDQVAPAMASQLGLALGPGEDPAEALSTALGDTPTLLVLDNCEHLVDAIARIADDLLRKVTATHVLATSREPLGVEGERVFRVPSMRLPDDVSDPEAVARAEAVQLFVERAALVRPDFELLDDDIGHVAEICRRLDGIPLAIELAAARTRVLQPAEIATGLERRFALLTGSSRSAVPRQRTLEASVEWSYDLLEDDERRLLTRLTVFADSFDLDAVDAVCSDEDAGSSLDLLTSLVDRSLVQPEPTAAQMRYRLLETIDVFARERIGSVEEVEALRDRHLEHFVRRASRLAAQPIDAALAAFDDDIENLRRAMDWAMESGQAADVIDIIRPTYELWTVRSAYRETHERLDAALTAPLDDTTRVRGLTSVSQLALMGGDMRAADRYAAEAVPLALELGHAARAEALVYRAWTGSHTGRLDEAQVFADIDAALAAASADGREDLMLFIKVFRGQLLVLESSVSAGRAELEAAIEAAERAGDPFFAIQARTFASQVASLQLDFAAARAHATAALEAATELGYPAFIAMAELVLAMAGATTDPVAGRKHLERAIQTIEDNRVGGIAPHAALVDLILYIYGDDQDGLGEAAQHLIEVAHRHGHASHQAWGHSCAGQVALLEARPDEAAACFGRALEIGGGIIPRAFALVGLALTDALRGRWEDAWDGAHEAVEHTVDRGLTQPLVHAVEAVAIVGASTNRHELAARLFGAVSAQPLPMPHLPLRDEAERAIVDAIGQEASDRCRAEGIAMSLTEAVELLRRGRGSRGRPDFGADSLTPTEQQVADLVVEGLTNAAIAEKLFVSPNTVKTHLTHIYAKLQVKGRAGLASTWARRMT